MQTLQSMNSTTSSNTAWQSVDRDLKNFKKNIMLNNESRQVKFMRKVIVGILLSIILFTIVILVFTLSGFNEL